MSFVVTSLTLCAMDEGTFRSRYFAANKSLAASSNLPRMTVMSPQGTYAVVAHNGYILFIMYGQWNHERAYRHPGREVHAVQFSSETKLFLMFRDGGSETIDLVAYFK